MDKQTLRASMLANRKKLGDGFVKKASEKIANFIRESKFVQNAEDILIYLPIKNEVQTQLLLDYLLSLKKRLYLPAYFIKDWVISEYSTEDLIKVYQDVWQPNKLKIKTLDKIDLAIVPGVAFSKDGKRLGYGKGVYDRLLAGGNNVIKVGLCYDFQIVENFEGHTHDVKMDYLCSERKLIKII